MGVAMWVLHQGKAWRNKRRRVGEPAVAAPIVYAQTDDNPETQAEAIVTMIEISEALWPVVSITVAR